MTDSLPIWVWLPALFWWAWVAVVIFVEVRSSLREFRQSRASNPVVVSGSGHRSNRHPRACGGAR